MARGRGLGFSLVELLVVISIIAVLMAVLLPVLGRARAGAVVAQCGVGMKQVGTGVYAYATASRGRIPAGPALALPPPWDGAFRTDELAANFVWLAPRGAGSDYPFGAYVGHGVLLDGWISDKRAMLCPSTNRADLIVENLENIASSTADGLVNYMYRSFDQATGTRIDDLGRNDAGGRATVLLLDLNERIPAGAFGPDPFIAINHDARTVNALYIDGHVRTFSNAGDRLTLTETDYASFPSFATVATRTDEILIDLDQEHR